MIETKFKQTEIGLIPEDWEVKSLSELCDNFTGLTYDPNDVRDFGTLVLRSSNIQNDALAFDNNVYVKMDIPERAMAKKGFGVPYGYGSPFLFIYVYFSVDIDRKVH